MRQAERWGAVTVEPIGRIHSCYSEKFGIPRQAGLAAQARATVELYPEYADPAMVRELEQFSHVWVHFLFHACIAEGWKKTVRPPGLGGRKRVGVFASRSPHRPNHLGLSAVALVGVKSMSRKTLLEVAGGDFLDGSPVLDIKPYIPYCDSIPVATSGYAGAVEAPEAVFFSKQAERFCRSYRQLTGRNLRGLIEEVVMQDPRPASQRARAKEFGCLLWEVNVRWRMNEAGALVLSCTATQESW